MASSSWFVISTVLLWLAIVGVDVLAVENHVSGPPKVQCGSEFISVSIPTKKPFLGRIFVKGLSKHEDCSRQYDNNTDPMATVEIKFGSCGMNRERKLSPVPGLEESITLIVSFHYLFVTKTDRAYNIQCFFGQQNLATVTFGYNVSLMSTEMIQYGQRRQSQPMPACKYEVRKGTLNGSLVQYATVGDELWHMWSCDRANDTSPEGRILVKNCYVAEGNGDRFLVIDSRGCAIDPTVISDLSYEQNASAAWVRTFAFKFADTSSIAFSCTIQVCFPDESNCDDVTPPQCSIGEGTGDVIKATRRLADSPVLLGDEIDVSSSSFNVLDSGLHVDSGRTSPLITDLSIDGNGSDHNRTQPARIRGTVLSTSNGHKYCLSKLTFILVMLVTTSVLAAFIIISIVLFVALHRAKKAYRWRLSSAWSFPGF